MLKQNLNWSCLPEPWGETSRAAEIVTQCCYGYFLLKLLDLVETVWVKVHFKKVVKSFSSIISGFLRHAEEN